MTEMPESLLAADEPAPVTVHNENGLSPFLIVADHAGNSMPRSLGRLGVLETECERHIAWDIGIAAVCRLVADALDAARRAVAVDHEARIVLLNEGGPAPPSTITMDVIEISFEVGLSAHISVDC
jgi:predicted N-formylglutamate amidohydrolase